MSVIISSFLRNALYADAAISGGAAIVMAVGAPLLSPLLGLPAPLLFVAGVALIPFVAMLVVIARRPSVARFVLVDLIALNVLWVAASFGLLVSGMTEPNALGVAFVVVQAVVVAFFAQIQFVGLRRSEANDVGETAV